MAASDRGLGAPAVCRVSLRVCSGRRPYPVWEAQEGFQEEALFKLGGRESGDT